MVEEPQAPLSNWEMRIKKHLIVTSIVLIVVYIPFIVIGLKIASSPYSQCLDYVKEYNHQNGGVSYNPVILRSFFVAIAHTCVTLAGLFLIFSISVGLGHNRKCVFFGNLLVWIVCLIKPLFFGFFIGMEIFGTGTLAHHCPSSFTAYFIVFFALNLA